MKKKGLLKIASDIKKIADNMLGYPTGKEYLLNFAKELMETAKAQAEIAGELARLGVVYENQELIDQSGKLLKLVK